MSATVWFVAYAIGAVLWLLAAALVWAGLELSPFATSVGYLLAGTWMASLANREWSRR